MDCDPQQGSQRIGKDVVKLREPHVQPELQIFHTRVERDTRQQDKPRSILKQFSRRESEHSEGKHISIYFLETVQTAAEGFPVGPERLQKDAAVSALPERCYREFDTYYPSST